MYIYCDQDCSNHVFYYQEEYQLPSLPIKLPTFDGHVDFGREMKKEHFLLDVGYIQCRQTLNNEAHMM